MSGWSIIAAPGNEPPRAAIEAAGPDVLRYAEPMHPKEAMTGRCRLCGVVTERTREHTPTKATSDLGPTRNVELDEWLARPSLDRESFTGVPTQGGIWGYTLCGDCNNLTGTAYGDEYKQWVFRAWGLILALPRRLGLGDDPGRYKEAIALLDQKPSVTHVEFTLKDVDAGRFVRQVLATMCSVAGPWLLTERHPEVRAIVLEGGALPLPSPLQLVTTLYVGRPRILGPTIHFTRDGAWSWMCELAYVPFAHRLLLASARLEQDPKMNVGDLTLQPPGGRGTIRMVSPIGFGHTPFPGDYRTRAQLEARRPE